MMGMKITMGGGGDDGYDGNEDYDGGMTVMMVMKITMMVE